MILDEYRFGDCRRNNLRWLFSKLGIGPSTEDAGFFNEIELSWQKNEEI